MKVLKSKNRFFSLFYEVLKEIPPTSWNTRVIKIDPKLLKE